MNHDDICDECGGDAPTWYEDAEALVEILRTGFTVHHRAEDPTADDIALSARVALDIESLRSYLPDVLADMISYVEDCEREVRSA